MRSTDIGSDYEELAHLIVEACGDATDGLFLYAEVEPGVVGSGLFQELGGRVVYHHPTRDLTNKLDEIWEKLDGDDRWHAIRCRVVGGRFSAEFDFPSDLKPGESLSERRPRALNAVFGDKRIEYPEL
ncbi:hypothetical protein [Sphingomonas sp. SUN039]|uniref:hypothetical protein n=1 Tax=Sphingomonas sp. SUN039 TaxID=2937787 RepID=UPI002164AA23|nr:hypothetical protein [Sphingomonas sp. SUN039]UVO55717.1 hypothetical protein M0209_16955 [Sphingomonas sp. SUN039]